MEEKNMVLFAEYVVHKYTVPFRSSVNDVNLCYV